MNRKQRICISVGIMLIVLAGLYPPWSDWYWGERRPDAYGFLLTPDAVRKYVYEDVITLHWQTLINEWLIIATICGGLFLMFRDPKQSASKTDGDSTLTGESKGRWLRGLTLMLAVLIGCFSLTTYAAVRKIKRLEAGIRNVKAMIGELPPTHPVGKLRPLEQNAPSGVTSLPHTASGDLSKQHSSLVEGMQQELELVEQEREKDTNQLRQIKEELEKLD